MQFNGFGPDGFLHIDGFPETEDPRIARLEAEVARLRQQLAKEPGVQRVRRLDGGNESVDISRAAKQFHLAPEGRKEAMDLADRLRDHHQGRVKIPGLITSIYQLEDGSFVAAYEFSPNADRAYCRVTGRDAGAWLTANGYAEGPPPEKPIWDSMTLELRFRGVVCRKFTRKRTNNQILIISEFSDNGWPKMIAKPQTHRSPVSQTVKDLQRRMNKYSQICFYMENLNAAWRPVSEY